MLSAKDLHFSDVQTQTYECTFTKLSDDRFRIVYEPAQITLELDRVSRKGRELWGELIVMVSDETYPDADTVEGVVTAGDLNLSSVQARTTRAKLIAERTKKKEVDWYGLLERFILSVFNALREGTPAVVLADIPEQESEALLTVDGLVLPYALPSVLYGASSHGKSLIAMYLAGRIAQQDVNVLYLDWEFDPATHARRFSGLFPTMPRNVFYCRCERGLRDELERVIRTIRDEDIHYVILDSIGFAVDDAQSQEVASQYAACVRQLRVGSLSLAHVPKHTPDGVTPDVFGSSFYRNQMRAMWLIRKDDDRSMGDTIHLTVEQTKNSIGPISLPLDFRMTFAGTTTEVRRVDGTVSMAPTPTELVF